jgi:hypothetical protein
MYVDKKAETPGVVEQKASTANTPESAEPTESSEKE